ncbi:MAG TPA: bifunctional serine/threonine-protein kinase/formylglycine-generating enzyme family protein [Kofleriaceae bacterium]|nr:bifunctional serine/threonine-protein kinase/formylglycine-generating enzyme family protein [Kofleriaceae bacterium]
MECPEAEALVAMASGGLSVERRAEIANHAAWCAPCHAALEALLRSHTAGLPADSMASTPDVDQANAETLAESEEDRARHRQELSAGDRVARYMIEAVLGRGGMGVVYRARDPELGRAVAIKVLRRGAASGKRLRREAQALAKLSHPNVVAVHDVGTHDGQPFIAMALVEGDTLRQWLITPRPLPAVLDVLLAAGRGLAAAHEAGLIHRDLKPDNIFVAHNGQVLVGDFGLARGIGSVELEAAGSTGDDELAPALTQSGMVLGTPAYMAPEQAAGDATMASDQFSFCVMAWEAFTRARPFAGTSTAELLANIRSGSVTEPEGERALPSWIDTALRRGLAADPARRFPSMTALLGALEPTQHAHRLSPEPGVALGDPRSQELGVIGDLEVSPTRAAALVALTARSVPRRAGRRRAIWVTALAVVTASAAAWPVYRAFRGPASPPPSSPESLPAEIAGMIWLPGGTFRMGRTAEEVEAECKRLGTDCLRYQLDREQPAREVTLSPFYLDEREATNEEVARWLSTMKPSIEMRMDDEGNVRWVVLDGLRLLDVLPPHTGIVRVAARGSDADGDFIARPGYEHKPVAQITWDGASLYCKGRGKRLPTEAEWELAARGRTARRFPWGDQVPRCDEVAWGRDKNMPCAPRSLEPGPLTVGTAPLDRTPEGVRDLGGNVMEWVQDQFLKPYLPGCGKCVDPRIEAQVPLQEDIRVLRGGSWSLGWHKSRSTVRSRWKRTEVNVHAGVRCASR